MKRAALLAVLLIAAGCAGSRAEIETQAPVLPQPAGVPMNLVPDGYHGRFRLNASVLENEEHGPQLCLAMALSRPPQCGGPDIAGWKWDGLPHEAGGTVKWGRFTLTGKFDGKTFTLTEPAEADTLKYQPKQAPSPDFTSPCPAPPGGWKPVDAAKATSEAMNAVNELVMNDPDLGGLWIDETPDPALPTPANNPARLVLNVSFTKDLDRHQTEIRTIWGGALCLSVAKHSEADLRGIQHELMNEPGVTSAGVDIISGSVQLGMFRASESRQRELDAKYGTNVVVLHGVMEPLD